MANEITVGGSLRLNRSTAPKHSESMKFSGIQSTQAGNDYASGSQTIQHTADEALAKGEIGTIGFFMLKNLDPTNFVTIGLTDGGTKVIKVLAGHSVGPVYVDSAALWIQADTASVIVQYLLIEK